MFLFRKVLQCGTRLVLRKEPINLHQLPLIQKGRFDVRVHERTFIRTKTNLCESSQNTNENTDKNVLGKIQGKMKLFFTCKRCNYRNSKIISKLAYQKGVIIIRCDGCKNNHLIADNLGWFKELQKTNIEKLLAAKGETVRKVINDADGYIEVVEREEFLTAEHNKRWEQAASTRESKIHVKQKKDGTTEET